MKKYIKWGVVVGLLLVVVGFFGCSYNSMIDRKVGVETAWSNVESQFQRRADLIPNLVSTVKGYATHEQMTFVQVVEARAAATQPQIKFDDLTDENLAKFQAAQGELGAMMGRLLAIGEGYPTLRASENFQQLQDEVSGTENRINKARIDFNEAVRSYNTYVQKFPRNMVAMMFGFAPKSLFEAETGAEKAPKIEF